MRLTMTALLFALTLTAVPLATHASAQVPGLELAQPAAEPAAAPAAEPAAPSETQKAIDEARGKAAEWVRNSVDATKEALIGAKEGVKEATGLNDDQLYGIGVGVLAGVAAADILGTGGLGSLAVVSIGGMLGNWVATRGLPTQAQ